MSSSIQDEFTMKAEMKTPLFFHFIFDGFDVKIYKEGIVLLSANFIGFRLICGFWRW